MAKKFPLICRKVPYATRREAVSVLKYRADVFGKPYICLICGKYHLGHKTPKKSVEGIKRRNRSRKIKNFNKLLDLIDLYCGV